MTQYWEDIKREGNPTPNWIQTHDLSVVRSALYHRATTPALMLINWTQKFSALISFFVFGRLHFKRNKFSSCDSTEVKVGSPVSLSKKFLLIFNEPLRLSKLFFFSLIRSTSKFFSPKKVFFFFFCLKSKWLLLKKIILCFKKFPQLSSSLSKLIIIKL